MLQQSRLDEMAIHIGTARGTGGAADTFFAVYHDDAVIANPRCAGRAGARAGSIVAVIAEDRQKRSPRLGVSADLAGDYSREMYIFGRTVLLFAGERAGVASDTALQVNDHSQSCHVFPVSLHAGAGEWPLRRPLPRPAKAC